MDQIPSGTQFRLASGGTSATVVEVGGALRELQVDGRRLLDGYPAEEICDGARGQPLLPWPNRIADGRFHWQGKDLELALSEPANSCAIHGLTRWSNWRSFPSGSGPGSDSIRMTYRLPPQTGWLWVLDLAVTYTVDVSGITVETSARNLSATPAPFAAGAHPYLSAGTDLVDDAVLHVPAASWLPTGRQQMPTGVESVDGTRYDFRTPRRIGATTIDYAYTDLDRDAEGIFRARLTGSWPVEIWLDSAYRYLEVFTGDTLPQEPRRRRGLGVEPMSAPPNAFATGIDVVTLEPGATWTGRWGIRLAD